MSASSEKLVNRHSVWVVTGASSGIGQAIALEAIQCADITVIAIGRKQEGLKITAAAGCRTLSLDLTTSVEKCTQAIDSIVASCGKIDVLVNAAGYLLEGAVEETSDEESVDVFQTNFFGPLRLIRASLRHMRQAGSGVIFNVAGVATYNGSPNAGIYCASKAAMSSVTEALQRETDSLGIRVCLVQLGHFRTPFLRPGHRRRVVGHIEDYNEYLKPLRKKMNALNGTQPGDPELVGQILVELASDDIHGIPFFLALGSDVSGAMQKSYKARIQIINTCEHLTNSTDLQE
ncbi:hypothetical protein F5Y19DRAFT_149368 [Xylariaceae sp. FL1651]|nr:hypothetical protein F5Y19DRAFT_149368 [Xylariaceae sp. FL1651]